MYRILPAVPASQWREPSRAQPRDQFGNQNRTCFRLTARLNDGAVRWRGWFDSREDADAFLCALGHHIAFGDPVPTELWHLPSPGWHPDIGPFVSYDFTTLAFLTSSVSSLQTYTSAVDWNNTSNSIDAVAAGGGGGYSSNLVGLSTASGGGGGEWRRITNFNFAVPGTSTAQYQVGVGGVISGAVGVDATGNGPAGLPTWFNGASSGAATLSALGGGGGFGSHGSSRPGGTGGTGGAGTLGFAGGTGGSISGNTSSRVATGGGGAGGQSGAGSAGVSRTTNNDIGTNGGAADNGATAGGAGSGGGTGGNGTAGSNGTEYDSTHGSGGGGGGAQRSSGSVSPGDGGNYGGGGGGGIGNGGSAGGGGSGIVVVSYQATLVGRWGMFFGGGV